MSRIKTNGVELEFETFGKPSDRPILLIMGLASQMVAWPDAFCRKLAAGGHHVVRFDNRDIGHSSRMSALPVPDIFELLSKIQGGETAVPPYTLSDMAGDAAGLLDALGIEKAHICGFSMGGMIAQVFALEYPQRTLTLTSMASTTNEPDLPAADPEVMRVVFSPAPAEREAYIRFATRMFEVFAGGSDKFDKALQREIAARSFDRGVYPPGFIRQFAAVLTAKGRRQTLKSLGMPALVVHGIQDTLVPFAHGEDTAGAIPGAAFLAVDGLGHGLAFPDLWDEISTAIARHTAV